MVEMPGGAIAVARIKPALTLHAVEAATSVSWIALCANLAMLPRPAMAEVPAPSPSFRRVRCHD